MPNGYWIKVSEDDFDTCLDTYEWIEVVDEVDRNGRPTGRQTERHTGITERRPHRF